MGVATASTRGLVQWIRESWYALVPGLTTLLLGTWGIANASLWLDERFTLSAIENGLASHTWEAPLLPYYALMAGWTGAGSIVNDGWLRALSVLAAAVGSVAVAITARRLLTVKAGLAAGMIYCLAPGVSRYAQEARPYALAAALVAVATLLLVDGVLGGKRPWIGYALALSSAAVLLPVSLAVIPAHAVILTGVRRVARPGSRLANRMRAHCPRGGSGVAHARAVLGPTWVAGSAHGRRLALGTRLPHLVRVLG